MTHFHQCEHALPLFLQWFTNLETVLQSHTSPHTIFFQPQICCFLWEHGQVSWRFLFWIILTNLILDCSSFPIPTISFIHFDSHDVGWFCSAHVCRLSGSNVYFFTFSDQFLMVIHPIHCLFVFHSLHHGLKFSGSNVVGIVLVFQLRVEWMGLANVLFSQAVHKWVLGKNIFL